jgi:hypothetical protein
VVVNTGIVIRYEPLVSIEIESLRYPETCLELVYFVDTKVWIEAKRDTAGLPSIDEERRPYAVQAFQDEPETVAPEASAHQAPLCSFR